MSQSHLSTMVQDPEMLKLFQQERLLIDTATLIYRTMQDRGLKRTKLAELLGVSKARVTQYLGGERNLTLRTLADIFTAMKATIAIQVEPLEIEGQEWQSAPELTPTFTGQPNITLSFGVEDNSSPFCLAG